MSKHINLRFLITPCNHHCWYLQVKVLETVVEIIFLTWEINVGTMKIAMSLVI
jgi:hypothetical protein